MRAKEKPKCNSTLFTLHGYNELLYLLIHDTLWPVTVNGRTSSTEKVAKMPNETSSGQKSFVKSRSRPAPAAPTPIQTQACAWLGTRVPQPTCRSEEHTSELQSLMRLSYAVFCLKKKK